jgi:hypothetical protein
VVFHHLRELLRDRTVYEFLRIEPVEGSHRAEDFWPPVFHQDYLQVGAYIVTYEPSDAVDESSDILSTDLMANATVIPLPVEAIARRLGKVNA